MSESKSGADPLRVLALTRYGALGASSRVRMMQYLPALKQAGMEVCVSSLLDDRYISALYARQSRWGSVATSYVRRCRAMHSAADFDVVWLEKECLPWLPSAVESSLLPAKSKLVVDYDDAWFHRYDKHASRIVRSMLGGKIDAVMRRADLVTAGNEYLAARAAHAGARRIEALPTVVDPSRYRPGTPRTSDALVVGWIGAPSTAKYLHLVTAALDRVHARHAVRCVAIGARPDQVVGTPFEAVQWSEEAEVGLIQSLDIGIMPLLDDSFERGKCGYKLIQYMACGLPVVASPVGVNCKIVNPGVNGLLADTPEVWEAALERLVDDATLRLQMGAEGRRLVEDWYSLDVQAPRLIGFLRSVAGG